MQHPLDSFFGHREPAPSTLGAGDENANLPSGESANDLLDGKPGGVVTVLGHTLLRSVLIGSGMAVAGLRGKQLVKGAIAGSVAIETFVLGYMLWSRANKTTTST